MSQQGFGVVEDHAQPLGEVHGVIVGDAGERVLPVGGVDVERVDHSAANSRGRVQADEAQVLDVGRDDGVVEPVGGNRPGDVGADGDGGLGVAQGFGVELAGGVFAELVEEPDAGAVFAISVDGVGRATLVAGWPVTSVAGRSG